jgi:hypothetical protein
MRALISLLALAATVHAAAVDRDFVKATFSVALPAPKPSTVWIEAPAYSVAPPKDKAPAVDGKLDDECWKNATVLQIAQRDDEIGGAGTAVAFVSFSADAFCAAVVCPLPSQQFRELLSKHRERDHDVWMDESVELFIDAGRTQSHYFQFIVNTLNDQQDGEGWTGSWNGDWRSATHMAVSRDDPALPALLTARPECQLLKDASSYWICEISIPFATIGCKPPAAGDKWGLQIAHNDALSGSCATLSKPVRSNHEPQNFAELKCGDPGPLLSPIGARIDHAGSSCARFRTNRDRDTLKRCALEASVTRGDNKEPAPVTIDEGGGISVGLPTDLVGAYRVCVELHEPGVSKKTATSNLLCHVRPKPKPYDIALDQNQYYASEKIARCTIDVGGEKIATFDVTLKGLDKAELRRGTVKMTGAGNECELSIQDLPLGHYTVIFAAGAQSQSAEFDIVRGPFDEAAQP